MSGGDNANTKYYTIEMNDKLWWNISVWLEYAGTKSNVFIILAWEYSIYVREILPLPGVSFN
jgi:hypothetical protein